MKLKRIKPWPAPNARFWEFINDGPVKITVRPGQTLRRYHRGPTDEGWSSEYHEWDWDGETLVEKFVSDGRDCDGRLTRTWTGICPMADLQKRPAYWTSWTDSDGYHEINRPDIHYPQWRDAKEFQRDYAAESAGY